MASIFFTIVLSLMSSLHADGLPSFLTPAQVQEAIQYLPPSPAPGSATDVQDFEVLERIHADIAGGRISCDLPRREALLIIPEPFVAPLGPLTPAEREAWRSLTTDIFVSIKPVLKGIKTLYNRPRPYLTHPELTPCAPLDEGKAYPSAHAFMGELFGRIFASVYADRAEGFLARGKQYGFDRVIGGVHHPSDVAAGQALADHVYENLLLTNPDFVQRIEQMKTQK